ncbi:MAG: LamG domain-containing protein [Myxococcota bacterium]|nr:LamG domain-containing protein [Myxococcota bacterium]
MRFVLVVLAGCGFSTSVASDGSITDTPAIDALPIDGAPGSARKRRITIPDAKVFATVTDFPLWLVIDDMPGLGAKATTAGTDIFFTRLDGTPLEHERVAWNKATGHLEAWVKVTLTDGGPSEFDLRFGDPGPAHAPNTPLVWTNNFQAVWHMDDALANTTVADARGAVNGTAVNGPVSVAGKLGKAIDFDGMNDEVTFTNPIAGDASTTISAWISIAQPISGFSSVMTVGNPATNQSRFLHTDLGGLCRGFYGNDVQLNIDVHNSTFTLLHWVYDEPAATSTLYRDGALVGTVATVNGTINTLGNAGHIGTAPMQWGPGGNTTNPINGLMDEVRIAATPRSLGWVRTEYENQRDAKMFYVLGDDVPAQ